MEESQLSKRLSEVNVACLVPGALRVLKGGW